MRATSSKHRFAVGEYVQFEFGGRAVVGQIVEDLGQIGVSGRQLLRVEAYLPADELMTFELPGDELIEARCHGHVNGFHHLDPGIPTLDSYDLGIKLQDCAAPPPPGSPTEPRLYLYVSVRSLESGEDFDSIHYARSRGYLKDGFPSSQEDRRRLTSAVLHRLENDVRFMVSGELHTSEEEPLFVQAD